MVWKDGGQLERAARLGGIRLGQQPSLDRVPLVRVPIGSKARVHHELLRDGADEVVGWLGALSWCHAHELIRELIH